MAKEAYIVGLFILGAALGGIIWQPYAAVSMVVVGVGWLLEIRDPIVRKTGYTKVYVGLGLSAFMLAGALFWLLGGF